MFGHPLPDLLDLINKGLYVSQAEAAVCRPLKLQVVKKAHNLCEILHDRVWAFPSLPEYSSEAENKEGKLSQDGFITLMVIHQGMCHPYKVLDKRD